MKKQAIKTLMLLLFMSFTCLNLSSQSWKRNRAEWTFGLGATNFLGDLGGMDKIGSGPFSLRDMELNLTRLSGNIGYRYMLRPDMRLKGLLTYCRVEGDDKLTNEPARNYRNLKFRSPIVELSLTYEYYLFQERAGHLYKFKGVRGARGNNWNMYVFGGIGAFWFNPKGPLNGRWYALQPLGTEGQGLPDGPKKKYSRISVSIPVGVGIRYTIDRFWSVNLEFNLRKTFTDYIDDVSTVYYDKNVILQERGPVAAYFADPSSGTRPGWTAPGEMRGDSNDKDAFLSAIISVNYKFIRRRGYRPKF